MEELQLQSIIVSEEEGISHTIDTGRLENDVLRMRIGVMAKDHAAEKNEIIKTNDKTIGELKVTNEELNIKIGDQSDKMNQMDKASRGKDNEIESLTKQVGELSEQKHQLEMNLEQAKVMYKQSTVKNVQKEERIKELESELSKVKKKLAMKVAIIATAEQGQESLFATYNKKAEENQERRDKQLQENEERRDKQLQENEERRDKKLQENEERRDKKLQENEERRDKQLQKNEERRDKQLQKDEERREKTSQKNHDKLLCQIKSMGIISKSLAVKDSKVMITDSRNVHVTFESQNGRNDDACHRTSFYNRNTCKPSKGNNNLPK